MTKKNNSEGIRTPMDLLEWRNVQLSQMAAEQRHQIDALEVMLSSMARLIGDILFDIKHKKDIYSSIRTELFPEFEIIRKKARLKDKKNLKKINSILSKDKECGMDR